MVSNVAGVKGLERAQKAGVATKVRIRSGSSTWLAAVVIGWTLASLEKVHKIHNTERMSTDTHISLSVCLP